MHTTMPARPVSCMEKLVVLAYMQPDKSCCKCAHVAVHDVLEEPLGLSLCFIWIVGKHSSLIGVGSKP